MRLEKKYFIWLLSVLIVSQSVWLNIKLKKLYRQSPEYLLSQQQREAETNLQSIPEPEIKQTLSVGGRLWLDSGKVNLNQDIKLNIWASFEKPVSKIDLRLFYPPDMLEVVDPAWQVDKDAGLASWLSSNNSQTQKEQVLTTITFRAKNPGIAILEFDFNKGSMLDSNLVDIDGKDILEEVKSGEVIVNYSAKSPE